MSVVPPVVILLAVASLIFTAAFLGLAAWHGLRFEKHRKDKK